MTHQNINIVRKSFLLGVLFALGMVAFDYIDGTEFSIWKFLFSFSFFSIAMTYFKGFTLKESSKE